MSKCDVCGKETKVYTSCSACGAISYAYCADCLRMSIEPYDALVGMGLFVDEIAKDFKKDILLPSLKFHGKTIEEFNDDVKQFWDSYFDFLQHQDECVESECEADWF